MTYELCFFTIENRNGSFDKFDLFIVKAPLKDCKNKNDALKIDSIMYEILQKLLKDNTCGFPMCSITKYTNEISMLSRKVLSKEFKIYGDGYFIIWSYYSSLYVREKIDQYLFDLDSALVAVGGKYVT